jgi:16S rRNA (guanine966-N2)-methyltransferase
LQSAPGMEIRPTADRTRETLFNVLAPGDPEALSGSTWLDLYAGTGAVGFEALSRGARKVYFVEASRRVAKLIARNVAALQVPPSAFELLESKSAPALRQLESRHVVVDFCFLDPPYRLSAEYGVVLRQLGESRLVQRAGVVIAEHHKKFDPGSEFGALQRFRTVRQGDAVLSFYRAAG